MLFPTLFDKHLRKPKNIIPHGGETVYYGEVFDEEDADRLYELLLRETPWRKDEWVIYNKIYLTPRKVAWYSIKRGGVPRELSKMKKLVESYTGVTYNHVLLNLYENGEIGLGWHSDKESWEENSSIASVSLGAERRFDFRHVETKETISMVLEHGSLLVMQGLLQNYWKHHLPKCKHVKHPRINLTFRK